MPHALSAERVVEELRVALFRKRISQDHLAAATGMSQSTISRRLNGEVEATLPELEKLARAAGLGLRVELHELAPASPSAAGDAGGEAIPQPPHPHTLGGTA